MSVRDIQFVQKRRLEIPIRHLSYGFGIDRWVGAHLADMRICVVWEEIVKRFEFVEVIEEPTRTRSNLMNGYTRMSVRVHARSGAGRPSQNRAGLSQ